MMARAPRNAAAYILSIGILGSTHLGCWRPIIPASWSSVGPGTCDLQGAWIHALDHVHDQTNLDYSACDAACRDRDRAGCVAMGLFMVEGHLTPENRTRARMLFDEQCLAGYAPGCIARWHMAATWTTPAESGFLHPAKLDVVVLCEQGELHACEALMDFYRRQLVTRKITTSHEYAARYTTRACQLGSPAGCTTLGLMHQEGFAVSRDEDKAGVLFEKECAAGYALACFRLGVFQRDVRGLPKNVTRSIELFQQSCAGGVPDGCYEGAMAHYFGKGTPIETTKGLRLYEKACTAGHPAGCYEAAMAYSDPEQPFRNEAKVVEYLEKGCDQKGWLSCFHLASDHYGKSADPVVFGKATQIMEDLCNRYVLDACIWIGKTYAYDGGKKRDDALRALNRACRFDNGEGCYLLARAYEPSNTPSDDERVPELLEKGCQLDWYPACVDLALRHQSGLGAPQDPEKAAQLLAAACPYHGPACLELARIQDLDPARDTETFTIYREACRLGATLGCIHVGDWLLEGRGTARDEAEAAKMYDETCQSGEMLGCFKLGELYAEGRGVAQDVTKAKELFGTACSKGISLGCLRREQLPSSTVTTESQAQETKPAAP